MREAQLRRIVEEIVRALAEKGYLKEGPCGCEGGSGITQATPADGPSRTTIGTAGKVFSSAWTGARAASVAAPRPQSPLAAASKREAEHTGGANCPSCAGALANSEAELKAIGADRIAVCHPTKKGSATARCVDHTLLKPNATQQEIAKLCEEAKSYCFASVCVNPSYVSLAAQLLRGSGVKVCTVVGFPLGSTTPTVKAIEARDAIANGADEIDMVINVGALKSGNDAVVFEDIKAVREAARGRVLKVILETALLSEEEKVRACVLSKKAGADFVKTSTGFGGGGATVEDVRLMRATVGPLMGVKASGGIRDSQTAERMLAAGATRLGTSASVAIVTGESGAGGKGY
ncbi:MAG: deoxyribose-phosphate aldolase [Elusimicrobia bacterium]|nr:deoxyribose-phosphate aldolase [Elusimicrobiota bacterium]MDE2236337.1 deoxyribose-phosphate aldolase [Elusimicrobiota bacterium]MDE2426492.1 deoxyribose-phosphate aldolase [Elusimicrobiota bacterium]